MGYCGGLEIRHQISERILRRLAASASSMYLLNFFGLTTGSIHKNNLTCKRIGGSSHSLYGCEGIANS